MAAWPRNPVIYEINTWAWLEELRRQYQCEVHLGTIPEQEWVRLASLGIDAVWFMGVWQRSPAGIALMAGNHAIRSQSERTLGDFEPADIIGSPYSIYQYRADDGLGGPQGLLAARQHVATYNIRLVLDFVANHVALDHPWTQTHPAYFIQGTAKDIAEDPGSFHEIHDHILACGRDPYFPAWPDVLQLNAFHPGYRQTAQEILRDIATMCDGVRCDMAMLVMNDIFSR
ncbi:MAG: alpha-amylase, partial [Syntrophales bacterium LBB04]|nr:alpha-amylase [Syntrophales bacterium LBB04]